MGTICHPQRHPLSPPTRHPWCQPCPKRYPAQNAILTSKRPYFPPPPNQFLNMNHGGAIDSASGLNPIEHRTSHSFAIRHAVTQALYFLGDTKDQNMLTLASLTYPDTRTKERSRPGNRGARSKKSWRRR